MNSSDWTTLATRVPGTSFTVDDLEADKMYTFLIRAENSHGLSPPSQPSEPVTLNPAEKIMEPVIEDKQTREARALLQAGHSAELLDIQPLNATSIKLTWEVGNGTAAGNTSKIPTSYSICGKFLYRFSIRTLSKASTCILDV